MKAHIIDRSIYKLIGEEQWANTELIIKNGCKDYKELKSDRGLLNYVIETYRSCRPFLKRMHLTLDSWCTHRYPGIWKQDSDELGSDLSEDKLGGEGEEALVQMNRTPSKGDATEKEDLGRPE